MEPAPGRIDPATPPPARNGDLRLRAIEHTAAQDWTASPSGSVWRKRVHRVGPLEAGQVTSVVRYVAGARFPAHDHPEGEEILVLDGVFCDEHGDWPAGTYLLNPEGFRHAPFSREGCLLFVKLRQFAGREREHVALDWRSLPSEPGDSGSIERRWLYRQPGFADRMTIERWRAGTPETRVGGGSEIFVLEGALAEGEARYEAGTWIRLPERDDATLRSEAGAVLYVKRGGFGGLWSAAGGSSA
jgi:anti-sigma factor ChrR (cupin superfamily)